MREILFKAKSKSTNEWVEGCYVEKRGNHFIHDGELYHLIDRDTLCQYIGRKDKEGNKIFEGDSTENGIVSFSDDLVYDYGYGGHPGWYFKGTIFEKGMIVEDFYFDRNINSDDFDEITVQYNIFDKPHFRGLTKAYIRKEYADSFEHYEKEFESTHPAFGIKEEFEMILKKLGVDEKRADDFIFEIKESDEYNRLGYVDEETIIINEITFALDLLDSFFELIVSGLFKVESKLKRIEVVLEPAVQFINEDFVMEEEYRKDTETKINPKEE